MFKPINVLIVDDDDALVRVFERLAKERGFTYKVAKAGNDAVELLSRFPFEAALVDIKLPGYSGIQILEYAKQNRIPTEVIMITGVGSVESAVDAIKKGAYNYLTKPFDDIEQVGVLVDKAIERYRMMQRLSHLEQQTGSTSDEYAFDGIVGKSRKIQEVFSIITAISGTMSTVLILGESGTGKELIARAIHKRSTRATKPFVVINCAAIPEQLLESELFGHRKGSFTGAVSDRRGLFEEAHGGTVFLDEIGEIPTQLQVKLLRVLQEGEVRPVGDSTTRTVDVRLIAATNRDLAEHVKEGKFREDLYYRLNVIAVNAPPLRDRPDDIPLLTYHFLSKCSARVGKKIEKISVDAMQALQSYSWSGNVRELENVIERAVVLVGGDTIGAQDLPPRILGESFYLMGEEAGRDLTEFQYQEAKRRALTAFNRAYIGSLLKNTKGNVSSASAKAGMDRSNFKKLIKRYSIDTHEFKLEDITSSESK